MGTTGTTISGPTDEEILEHVFCKVVRRPKLLDILTANGVFDMLDLLCLSPSECNMMYFPQKGEPMLVGDIITLEHLRSYHHYRRLQNDTILPGDWIHVTRDQYEQFCVYDKGDYDKLIVSSSSLPLFTSTVHIPTVPTCTTLSVSTSTSSTTLAQRPTTSFIALSGKKVDEDLDSSMDNGARSPPMSPVRPTHPVIGNDIIVEDDSVNEDKCFSTSLVSIVLDNCVREFSTSLNTVEDIVDDDIVRTEDAHPIYGHQVHANKVADAIDSCYASPTLDLADPFVEEQNPDKTVSDHGSYDTPVLLIAPHATRQPSCRPLTGRFGQVVTPKKLFQVDNLLVNGLPTYDQFPARHHHHMHPAMYPNDDQKYGTALVRDTDDEEYGTVPIHGTDDDEYEIVFIHEPGGGCSSVFQEAFSEEFFLELSLSWQRDHTTWQDRSSDNDSSIVLDYSDANLPVHQRTPDHQHSTHHVNLYEMFAYDHLQAHPHELVDNVYNVVDIVDMGTGDVVDDFTTVHDDPPPCENVLVHREANDKVVIADVRAIHCTTYMVDIQGVHKRMINDAYFGMAGSVVTTDKGSIILVLHQYALFSQGWMVHAHGQPLLWYNNDVNDKSSKVNRPLKTHNGFVIPLVFDRGLPRLHIRPFSDDNWEKSLHVNLIDKLELDPTVLAYPYYDPHEHEGWFDTTNDIELSHSVNHFYVFCQYRRRVIDQHKECRHRNVVVVPPTSCTSTVHEPERSAQRLLFGRVQPDVITMTLTRPGTTLKQTFILNTPSLLVYRHPEYVVCDEVCFDTSANDDGPNDIVLFRSLRPMVTDVYDIPLDLQYVNTHVNIMCYRILTSALEILRCDGDDFGRRTDLADGEVHHSSPPPLVVRSRRGTSDQQVDDDLPSSPTLSDYVVTLVDLVDHTFLLVKQDDGRIIRTRTIGIKIIACNDYCLRDELCYLVLRLFKQIVLYKHVDRTHPDCGSFVNIVVVWKNGEITPKPPTIIAADDPVTCTTGSTIPRSYQHTISLVRNSNTKWFDGIAVVSLVQVNVHPTYEDFGNAFTVGPPKDGRRQQVRRVCDRAFVSLRGVLTTTELNGSTTLSMDDLATPKHDTQVAMVPDVRTTPSREQASVMLDGSPWNPSAPMQEISVALT